MGTKEPPVAPDLQQATFEHCLDGWGQLGLAGLRATTPGAQEDAPGDGRKAPEVLPERTTNEFALLARERSGCWIRRSVHDCTIAQSLGMAYMPSLLHPVSRERGYRQQELSVSARRFA